MIVERLPEDVAGCILRLLPLNALEVEAEAGVLGWNLGRARAAGAVATIELAGTPGASGDACTGLWAGMDPETR